MDYKLLSMDFMDVEKKQQDSNEQTITISNTFSNRVGILMEYCGNNIDCKINQKKIIPSSNLPLQNGNVVAKSNKQLGMNMKTIEIIMHSNFEKQV